MGLLPKRGSATIFSVLGFFLLKTAANLPFTQRRRRHRRIACVVDTDNETVATSAQQQWEYSVPRMYALICTLFHRLSILERARDHKCNGDCSYSKRNVGRIQV